MYDVAILGSGQAAWNAGIALSKAGKNICMIENDLWGGTCPNRGCDPKKIFFQAAYQQYKSTKLNFMGVGKPNPMDWKKLFDYKQKTISPLSMQLKKSFEDSNITTIKGFGHFKEGILYADDKKINAEKVIIAIGQKPKELNILGKDLINNSYDLFETKEFPKKIVIIGGGYIAFEIASIINQIGSDVTIIHHNERPLKEFPESLVNKLVENMEKQGIKVTYNSTVQSVKEINGKKIVKTNHEEIITDYVLSAVGRYVDFRNMNLESAGIKVNDDGIVVDDYMQTSNKQIYAIGDCVKKQIPKLTTTAILEGEYISKAIIENHSNPISYPLIPKTVFTLPKLSTVQIEKKKDVKRDHKTINLADKVFTFQLHGDNEALTLVEFNESEKLESISMLSDESDVLINDIVMILNKDKLFEENILVFPTIQNSLSYLVNNFIHINKV